MFIFLVACTEQPKQQDSTITNKEKPLQNGDIICRLGNGFFSNIFREQASKEKIFSHIGIIEVASDSINVIHTEASELTGVGFVKKEPLAVFLDKIQVWEAYRFNLPDSSRNQIVNNAERYLEAKTPFDLSFNSSDDSEVYCSELVALSINKLNLDSVKIRPTLKLGGKLIYSLDDIYLHKNINKIY